VLSTFAVASIVVLAVVLYGFYYPAPYAQQTARQLPVVVVDEERSDLTRALVRRLSDLREVRIVSEADSIRTAEQQVRSREADGVLLLPRGLTRSLLTGAPGGGIGIWVNGTYLIRARDIGGAVQNAALAVAAERLGPLAQGLHLRAPIAVVERPLFNTREGYADYVFPAVAAIILQQTLLFGTAMLAAAQTARVREGKAARPCSISAGYSGIRTCPVPGMWRHCSLPSRSSPPPFRRWACCSGACSTAPSVPCRC
jgi:ABC-2 type transport system permease protein